MADRRGFPLLVAAPSGAGKTTLCRALVDRDPGIVHSISCTTRKPRPGERDGDHYHFLSPKEFRRMAEAGEFLESAEYGGNNYGTRAATLQAALDQGLDVLLEIEIQGARQVRERRPDARLVFLLPPSLEELERRLRGRGTDDDDVIERRLAIAREEIQAAAWFDWVVVNDDLEQAIAAVQAILAAEREGDAAALEALRGRWGRDAVLAEVGPRLGLAPP